MATVAKSSEERLRDEWWNGWYLGFAAGAGLTGLLITIAQVVMS